LLFLNGNNQNPESILFDANPDFEFWSNLLISKVEFQSSKSGVSKSAPAFG